MRPGVGLGRVRLLRFLVKDQQAEDDQHRQEQLVGFRLADLYRLVVASDHRIARVPGRRIFAEHRDPESGDGIDVRQEPADRGRTGHRFCPGKGVYSESFGSRI